jgi:hypothetical protein
MGRWLAGTTGEAMTLLAIPVSFGEALTSHEMLQCSPAGQGKGPRAVNRELRLTENRFLISSNAIFGLQVPSLFSLFDLSPGRLHIPPPCKKAATRFGFMPD